MIINDSLSQTFCSRFEHSFRWALTRTIIRLRMIWIDRWLSFTTNKTRFWSTKFNRWRWCLAATIWSRIYFSNTNITWCIISKSFTTRRYKEWIIHRAWCINMTYLSICRFWTCLLLFFFNLKRCICVLVNCWFNYSSRMKSRCTIHHSLSYSCCLIGFSSLDSHFLSETILPKERLILSNPVNMIIYLSHSIEQFIIFKVKIYLWSISTVIHISSIHSFISWNFIPPSFLLFSKGFLISLVS